MTEEKRMHKRVPTDFLVRATVSVRGDVQEGACRNLSAGGAFIHMDEPLPVGTEVRLELKLEPIHRTAHADGVVVWTRPRMPDPKFPPGVGVRFTELTDESRELIESVVEKLSKDQA